jgi:hypothetical protein
MKRLIPITVVATLLSMTCMAQTSSFPGAGSASDPGGSGLNNTPEKVSFDSLDTNKDGVISEQEAKANPTVSSAFKSIDKNNDKSLSRSELDAYFKKSG